MSLHSSFSDNHEHNTVPLGALRRLIRENRERTPKRSAREHCELCGTVLAVEHRHLLDLSNHVVLCACNECAVLFGQEGAGSGKYRTVSSRYLALPDFQMSDAQWDEFTIPVNMMYMLRNTATQRVTAFYPGPAGAMESLLDLAQWNIMVAQNPILRELEADVEALLINRVRNAREYYIVPIDECYRLVGLIRANWKGLSGGQEVWQAIEEFFKRLRSKARVLPIAKDDVSQGTQLSGFMRGEHDA